MLLGERHNLVGRLLVGIPDVNPNAGAREHGTTDWVGTRHGCESAGGESGKTEADNNAVHHRILRVVRDD
jgi:hypothetical protein